MLLERAQHGFGFKQEDASIPIIRAISEIGLRDFKIRFLDKFLNGYHRIERTPIRGFDVTVACCGVCGFDSESDNCIASSSLRGGSAPITTFEKSTTSWNMASSIARTPASSLTAGTQLRELRTDRENIVFRIHFS